MLFTLLLDRPGVCALASFYLFHTLMLAKANMLRSQILTLCLFSAVMTLIMAP